MMASEKKTVNEFCEFAKRYCKIIIEKWVEEDCHHLCFIFDGGKEETVHRDLITYGKWSYVCTVCFGATPRV